MFPDLKSLTSSCRLPGISTIFDKGPDDASLKQQHNNECTEIDKELFNMLLQPVMGTPVFTVEEFDNFVVPGQHLDPSPKTNPTDAHPKRSLKPILNKKPRGFMQSCFSFLCILNVVVIFYYIFINVQLLWLLHSIGPSP